MLSFAPPKQINFNVEDPNLQQRIEHSSEKDRGDFCRADCLKPLIALSFVAILITSPIQLREAHLQLRLRSVRVQSFHLFTLAWTASCLQGEAYPGWGSESESR